MLSASPNLKPLRIIVVFSCLLSTLVSIVFFIMGISDVSLVYLGGLPVLRIIHAVITAAVLISLNVLPKKILSGKIKLQSRMPAAEQGLADARQTLFFQRYLVSIIVQVALIEVSALF